MANNRKKGSPAGVIFALLMLVVIVVALIIVLRSFGMDDPAGSSPTPPVNTESVTDPPETEPPETEPPETEAPVTEPPETEPPETEEPSPSPSATPAANASGSFRSDTGTSLNIIADWSLSGSTLTINVDTESHTLYSSGAPGAASVSVNGRTVYFDTEDIEFEGWGPVRNELGSVTVEGVTAPAEVEVTWYFRGSYGGTELETITASGTVG